MAITWKWFLITLGVVLILGMIAGASLYNKLKPCPEIKPILVEIPIAIPSQEIHEEGIQKAKTKKEYEKWYLEEFLAQDKDRKWEIEEEKQPETHYIEKELISSWKTKFGIFRENYKGNLFVEFRLPDSLFKYNLQINIAPDTIHFTKYIDVPVPAPKSKSKIKFLYVYMGGGVSFSSPENTKLHIEGGCIDAGICIKKTWLIYGSIDSYQKIWLKTGFLF